MLRFMANYYNQMSHPQKQERSRKKKEVRKQEESEEDEEEDLDDDYEGSFIAEDDDISEDFVVPYIADDSMENHKIKKAKKDKKKDKKHRKEKKRRRDEDEGSFDEDDLDVIDNQRREFTRLKKRKEQIRSSSEEEEEEILDNNIEEGELEEEGQDIQSDEEGFGQIDHQSNQLSPMIEVAAHNMNIFDPADMKMLSIEDEDKDIAVADLPERYIVQLRNFAQHIKKTTLEVRKCLEEEDRIQEAEWAYRKLRMLNLLEVFDETQCKERIKKVLESIHREHLEIMYIYYYRKKLFSDYLNLDILWKIQEFDEEWYIFSEKQNKMLQFLEVFLPSYIDVPKELLESLQQCTDLKYLKYYQDYENFSYAKWAPRNGNKSEKKKYDKYNFITQMAESRVAEEIELSEIFLSPQNLAHNLKARTQERRPRAPEAQPKEEFERIMRANDSDKYKSKYPLLALDIRFKTISKYLCYELFVYPELRLILREKYYKKLTISTTPTIRGNQDIDLYSIYFPIKRIKEKPITTLKRQMWTLALEAEKKDLVKIELKFQWELSGYDKSEKENRERDTVYLQMLKHYYDMSKQKYSEIWNLFRRRVVNCMLSEYFIPSFMRQIKDDLTREGQKQIINACCQKLKQHLIKGPSQNNGKPVRILSMVLEETKLGVAFIDESGVPLLTFQTIVFNDDDLKKFVSDENLKNYIKDYKPYMILIAANCRRAQTLRKELRNPEINTQSIFCTFGEYQIPRLAAKKKIIMGQTEAQSILIAISMARLKKNPMAEIISLWSDKMIENGILSMSLHPYQGFVNQQKLKDCLERVIIETVNLVGLNLNEIIKNEHYQSQLQFVSGLGPKKAFLFLERMKEQNTEILNRKAIQQIVKGKIVAKNCSPFLKIETSFHRSLFDKIEKGGKTAVKQYEEINLLDTTRIPPEWYHKINMRLNECIKPTMAAQIKSKKTVSRLSEENIILLEVFKNSEKIRGIDWRGKDTYSFDEDLVRSEFVWGFKSPRESQRTMENKEIFFNLLRETPETFKRYMIMPVKILNLRRNFLNVVVPENGLFGSIKLHSSKSPEQLERIYEKGTTIKAVVIGFPFDERMHRDQSSSQEQQLLRIEMSLDFPHKDSDRHDGSKHDCINVCFPAIVKEIHPSIDLEKDRFQLKKEDKPQIEVREEKIIPKSVKNDFRRISHPKFKNISAIPAIELMKSSQIGDFVIRPSSQGNQYLNISWHFFKGVIVHIKVRCERKTANSMNMTYRVEDKDNRSYISLEEIIQKAIQPMNILVQDVVSNKRFSTLSLEQIENLVKGEMSADNSHIHYYIGVSEEYPQYFVLIYTYKDKEPIRELIKVKSLGLYFHDQQFSNIKDLLIWYKEHIRDKEYQKYVKGFTAAMLKK